MKTLWRLIKFIKPYWVAFSISIFLMMLVSVCELVAPLLVRKLISVLKSPGLEVALYRDVTRIALLTIGLYIFKGVLNGVSHYLIHTVGYGVLSDVRIKIYEHLQKLSQKFYTDRQTGAIMSRVTNDIGGIENFIDHILTGNMMNIIIFLGTIVIMLQLNWRLTLITIIPIPVMIFLIINFTKRVKKIYRKVYEKLSDISSVLQDNISGINVIQSFTQEEYARERFSKESTGHITAVMEAITLLSFNSPVIEIMGSVGTIIVIWYGGFAVVKAGLNIEDLVAFLLYIGFFYRPILGIAHILDSIQHTQMGMERIFRVLDTEPDVKDKKGAIKPASYNEEIEFSNVAFEYLKGTPILKGISFKIEKGKTVALVGPSGSGKTTIAKMIPRFYDPLDGSVKLGGHDLRDLQLNFLRRQVSMVLQDVFLFHGTIKENILYGKLKATEEELYTATKAACAHDFIMKLPGGYDSMTGERGVRLSGGQKQRISIARAILKNSPFLVLDEATSSVDTEMESMIKTALGNLMKNRTTLVIAHRLSTIQNADTILVVEAGMITESGKHSELLEKGGMYRRLYDLQFAGQDK